MISGEADLPLYKSDLKGGNLSERPLGSLHGVRGAYISWEMASLCLV